MAVPVQPTHEDHELSEAAIKNDLHISWLQYKYTKNSFYKKAKIASDFEPPPPKQISARKRAKNPEFGGGKPVGVPSARPRSGFFYSAFYNPGVFIRFRSNLLYQKFVNEGSRTRGARGDVKCIARSEKNSVTP